MKNILEKIIAKEPMEEGVAWKRLQSKANSVVVKKGDLGKTFFFIEKGILRVAGNVELDEQKRILPGVCDLESGAIFGETCLFHSQTRMATVTAVTDVEYLEIDGESLSRCLDDDPVKGYEFYKALFEVLIKRLDKANQRVENLMSWGLKVHEIDKFL